MDTLPRGQFNRLLNHDGWSDAMSSVDGDRARADIYVPVVTRAIAVLFVGDALALVVADKVALVVKYLRIGRAVIEP